MNQDRSELPAITAKRKTGEEKFICDEKQIEIHLKHFWQWSASDLLSNATRGKLAEFIVASALKTDDGVRNEWDSCDLKTDSGIRIEIKSSGYIQSWRQRQLSKIIFGIQPTRKWDEKTGLYDNSIRRQSDLYVFCVLAHQDPATINPLNLDQWDFYIVPTSVLNEKVPDQKTISLKGLEKIAPKMAKYAQLSENIEKIKL